MRCVLFWAGQWLGFMASLPCSGQPVVWVLLVLLALLRCFLHHRALTLLLVMMLGYSHVWVWAWFFQPRALAPSQMGRPVTVLVDLMSVPKALSHGQYAFNARLLSVAGQAVKYGPILRLRGQSNQLQVGARYRGVVQLKPLAALHNPGAPDALHVAFAKGRVATGKVLGEHPWVLIDPKPSGTALLRWRMHCWQALRLHLPNLPEQNWLVALLLGFTDTMPDSDWQLFRDTGTAHLMAISGLHIGFVAALMMVVGHALYWTFPGLGLRCPKPLLSCGVAWLAALFYSALAGFSLPTRRCLMMLGGYTASQLLRLRVTPVQILRVSLLLESLLHPIAWLSVGCWLSYGAVALIFALHHAGKMAHGWRQGVKLPVMMWVGMAPITGYFFGQFAWLAWLANAVAVPWVSVLILPVAFVGWGLASVHLAFGQVLIDLSVWQLHGLKWFLMHLKQHCLPWVSPMHWCLSQCVCAQIGVICVMFSARWPFKCFGLLWFLPCFLPMHAPPSLGAFRTTVLDVGQGLSVVVQTNKHALVYDTGLHFGHVDMGAQVLVPYLRRQGIKQIDALVVSHGDNDHAGGAPALFASMPVRVAYSSSEKIQRQLSAVPCHAGQSWWWDGVHFQMLWPMPDGVGHGNDHSCVLKIQVGAQALLLPGDISVKTEAQMLAKPAIASQLASSLLVAPHHGSKTSSCQAWLDLVKPRWVVYSTGLANRYGFPHQPVVSRYQAMGVSAVNTATVGAIQWEAGWSHADEPKHMLTESSSLRPIWLRIPFARQILKND